MNKKQDIDLAYALDLLQRINDLEVGGAKLSELTDKRGYNVWQWQQQRLRQEIRDFTIEKRNVASIPPRSLTIWIKDSLITVFMVVSTLITSLSNRLLGKQVLLYSIDKVSDPVHKCDVRINSIYAYLKANRVKYRELFHSVYGRHVISNPFRRRRLGLYVEVIDALYSLLITFRILRERKAISASDPALAGFSTEEREFVASALTSHLRGIDGSQFRISCWKFLLRMMGIKIYLTIDDFRMYHEMLVACEELNIPTYVFQHGHFTKHHVGVIKHAGFLGRYVVPSGFVVWSEYWKKELVRLGTFMPVGNISVVGNPKMSKQKNISRQSANSIRVLYPYENDGYFDEISVYLQKIIACPGVELVFKTRPDMDVSQQVGDYTLGESASSVIVTSNNDILDSVSLVVGTYSTYLYEIVERELPVAILETSSDFGEGLIVNRLAEQIDDTDEICQKISDLTELSSEKLKERRDRLVKGQGSVDSILDDIFDKHLYEKN